MKRKGLLIKTVKGFIAVLSALSFSMAAVACDYEDTSENLEVFSVHAQEKVLRNVDYADKSDKTLDITLSKNEYEGVQLILYAKRDIKNYDVKVSALVSDNALFDSDKVEIYNEKYMTLLHKKGSNPVCEKGDEIADALLPFETAKAYNENYVDKGKNQGVYIEVNTDESTVPGIYRGTVTVTADSQVYYVPINVTVYDIVLPLQSQAQNFWNNTFYTQYGTSEMDTTDEMVGIYLDKMNQYKLNGTLPFSGNGGAEAYVELIKEYYKKPGFSTYQFYYQSGRPAYTHKDRETGEYVTAYASFNSPLLKEYLIAVAKASVEDRVNYLDKAMFYFLDIIDEPTTEYNFLRCEEVASVFDMVIEDVAYELKDEYSGQTGYTYYMETMFDTILGLDNVLTVTSNTVRGELESRGIDSFTYCANIGLIASEEKRDYYAEMGDWWFYTSNSPYYPTATHHLDDKYTSLVSLGWMQKAYGIKGYLNWNVADYSERGYDAYEIDNVWGYSPGDGWIFYPGYEYGINGPVASLRAVALRDGIDDYDLFSVMEEKCWELGFSEGETQGMIETIFEQFITSTKPAQSCEVYQNAKNEIYSNILDTQDDLGLIVCDNIYFAGKTTVVFDTVNENATAAYNGQTLTRGESGHYEVTVDLSKTQSMDITVSADGQSKTIRKNVGNVYTVAYDFEGATTQDLLSTNGSSVITISNELAFSGTQSVKIALDLGSNTQLFFALTETFVKDIIKNNADEVELLIYSDYDGEIKTELQGFNGSKYVWLDDFVLSKGWNSVVIKNAASLSSSYNYKGLYFMVDSSVKNANIYIDTIGYVKKEG